MSYSVTCPRLFFVAIAIAWIGIPNIGRTVTIDFETIPTGEVVRDQFLDVGLKFTGTGLDSGLVFAEGDFSTANFGNSSTQIMFPGQRDQPTTIFFVDPNDSNSIVGATQFAILMGDGNPNSETFTVDYFDVNGNTLGTRLTFTTTSAGLLVNTTSNDLGANLGSVTITLAPESATGVTADDIQFELTPLFMDGFEDPLGALKRWLKENLKN